MCDPRETVVLTSLSSPNRKVSPHTESSVGEMETDSITTLPCSFQNVYQSCLSSYCEPVLGFLSVCEGLFKSDFCPNPCFCLSTNTGVPYDVIFPMSVPSLWHFSGNQKLGANNLKCRLLSNRRL